MNINFQLKNFLWYLLPFIFKNLLPLLVLPIFTKFLSVEDFGLYALALFYGVFGAGLINLGLSSVFERNFFELNSIKRKNILFTILVFTSINFLLVALLTFYFSENIAKGVFQQNQLKDLLLIALVFQTFKSFNQYFLIYLKNYENAKKYTYLSILESIFSIGLALIFVVYASKGIYGFVLGQSLGVFLIFFITFIYLFYPFSNRFEYILLKQQLKLSLPLTPRIFFGVINTQFDRYMLSLLATLGSVGLYDIGQKIANTTFTFMTTVQNVFAPQVYKRLFSNDLQIRSSVGRYLTPFFYLCIFVCLIIGIFSYEILYLLTPVEFHASAPIISILCLLYGFYFFGKQPQLLYAKKTGLISYLSFISIGLNIGLNIPMIHFFGVMGAVWATTIAGILSTGISFYYGQKFTLIKYEKKIYLILMYFIFSILFVVSFYDNLSISNHLVLIKSFIILVYIVYGVYAKIIDYNSVKGILV